MPYIFSVKLSFLLPLVIALIACPPLRGQVEPPPCSTYARCNELGTAALKNGRIDEAIELFKQQAALAEVADIHVQTKPNRARPHAPYTLAVPAYNNLALAYFKKHDYFWARAWAHVALGWDKNNRAAQFNLRKIEAALGNWRWPQTTAGKYVQYAGRGTWESFVVTPASADSIQFCFSGLWWGLGEGPSGIGDLRATVPIHESQAEYSTHEFGEKECRIMMRFAADKLEVSQTGDSFDCGFGHNVTAHGKFERISSSAKCPQTEGR